VKALIAKGFRASVVYGGMDALKTEGFQTEKDEGQ
jgi:rhodanese-related sulfurtransferase